MDAAAVFWESCGQHAASRERGGKGERPGTGFLCLRGKRWKYDLGREELGVRSVPFPCLPWQKSEPYVDAVCDNMVDGRVAQVVWSSDMCWFLPLLTGLFPRPCNEQHSNRGVGKGGAGGAVASPLFHQ